MPRRRTVSKESVLAEAPEGILGSSMPKELSEV